jgi:hypothetical protein
MNYCPDCGIPSQSNDLCSACAQYRFIADADEPDPFYPKEYEEM